VAKSRTGSLIKTYRDHNGMLNDAVLDALVHIAETTETADEETVAARIDGTEEKPQIASRAK
jgi:hypothetical protein